MSGESNLGSEGSRVVKELKGDATAPRLTHRTFAVPRVRHAPEGDYGPRRLS
jgi:hypothetical protein